MSQVISFIDYRPVARFDGDAWTHARVQEAASPEGPWTTIETISLAALPGGLDADPTNPAARSFTTDQADDDFGLWYRVLFADASGDISQPTFPFQNSVLSPGARDLCTLADVLGYVPGYRADDTATNDKLQQLITAESAQFQKDCDREIVPASSAASTRTFLVDRSTSWQRRVEIGDLSTIDDVTVTIRNSSGTTAEVVEESAVRPLYREALDPVDEWEPITGLSFPSYLPDSPSLYRGQTIEVEGVWGFPSVPPQAREGVAAGVVLRYLSDVAETGTDFAEALDTVNLGGLARRRADAIESLKRFVAA